jgi:hypothetical protein
VFPTDAVMPISMEQWRATVGSNNAAHSHVLIPSAVPAESKANIIMIE